MLNELEARLEAVVRQSWTHDDAAHDLSHIQRVRANALRIAADQHPEPDHYILLAAVWLHDLVQIEKNDPRRAEASRLAAQGAADLLAGWGWQEERCACVFHAIEAHSYSAGVEPRTPEAMILRDADRLDAIGAIGIARTFTVTGRLGRALYDPEDPEALHRPVDDGRFGLDHFAAKLFTLEHGMLTETGRSLARERTVFMRAFVIQLVSEIG